MSLRDSFSRLKKKLKHPLTGSKPKSDKTPAGTSNAAAEEHKSNWKSTASASAKLLLCGVRDSADAFGPLKSVAGGLCFILENCEVRPLFPCTLSRHLQVPQRTKANKQAIESLAPRVEALAESLCAPVAKEDTKERARRQKLEQQAHTLQGRELSLTNRDCQETRRGSSRSGPTGRTGRRRGLFQKHQECG